MGKLINPAPIIKKLAERCLVTKGIECSILGEVIDLLKAAPAADAVEVVQCKDCKHWFKSKDFSPFGWCCQRNDLVHVSYRDRTDPEDFCSKGERRNKC